MVKLADENENTEVEEIAVGDAVADEADTSEMLDEADQVGVEGDDDDGVIVTIGEESPPSDDDDTERAPEWVRDLRKQYREEKRRNRELEEKLAESTGAAKPAEPAKKPTLEGSDYDTERYETELATWYDKKRARDEADAQKRAEQEAVDGEWAQKLEGYKAAKTTLKVKDFEDAEDVALDSLSVTQQGMILQGAENPALLVYALGKNPTLAKEIASIKDPVKFAFAVARLETKVKSTSRKATSKPEPKISGTGRPSGSIDNTLERLRSDAEKTGDYSKVFAYKRQKKSA